MSKTKLIASMKNTLDGNAKEYGRYTAEETKISAKKKFEIEAMVFNTLLQDMHPRIKSFELFTTDIVDYICERDFENWE